MHNIARWESPRGKYFVLLQRDPNTGYYSYRHYWGGGTMGAHITHDEQAIESLQEEVDENLYLPDAATRPMRRVF